MTRLLFILLLVTVFFSSCESDSPDNDHVRLNEREMTLLCGNTTILIPSYASNTASAKAYTWTSSDPDVASVDAVVSGGKVTAKRVGTADITYRSTDNTMLATCRISVKSNVILLNGIFFKKGATVNEIKFKEDSKPIVENSDSLVFNRVATADDGIMKVVYIIKKSQLESTLVILNPKDDKAIKPLAEQFLVENFASIGRIEDRILYYDASVSPDEDYQNSKALAGIFEDAFGYKLGVKYKSAE